MQIGSRIMLGLVVLGLGLSGQLALDAMNAWRTLVHTQEMQALNLASDRVGMAASEVAMERGLMAGAIGSGANLTASQRDAALEQTRHTDDALAAAGMAASASPTGNLSAAQAEFLSQRAAVVRFLGGTGPAPSGTAWFAAATRLIEALTALRRAEEAQGDNQTLPSRLEAIRDRLAEMAEFAGRERGLVNGQIAAGQRPGPALVLALGTDEGRIQAAWERVESRLAGSSASLIAQVTRAHQGWFEDLAPLRAQVLQTAMSGGVWPVTAHEWFDRSTAAITAMTAAAHAVTEEMTALGEARRSAPRNTLIGTAVLMLLGLGVTTLIALNLRSTVVRPLRQAMQIIRSIANGQLDITLPTARGHDEIAGLMEATRLLHGTALEARVMSQERAAQRAAAEAARTQAMREIGDRVETISEEAMSDVRVMAQELQTLSGQVYTATATIAGTSAMAATDASEACEGTDQAAKAARELTNTIREIARQMELAARSTRVAVDQTDGARSIFAALSTSVTEIGEVAGLIAEIAGRTNLLALNATIEAARAGEAGRGFAVVAGEVKLLAQETERSTSRITQRISAIDATTRQAVDAMGGIARSISELDVVATAVAAAIEQQSAATNEIAEAVTRAGGASGRAAEGMNRTVEDAMACESTAGRMAKISRDAAGQVASLKGRLVHLMRANTTELERRRDTRHNLRRPARLHAGAEPITGEIVDISAGGACFIAAEASDWERPGALRLAVDGLPTQSVRITRSEDRTVHLSFTFTTEAEREAMGRAVEDLVARRPALAA